MGIFGNELADRKAKEASTWGINTLFRYHPCDLKGHWKKRLYDDFENWIQENSLNKGSLFTRFRIVDFPECPHCNTLESADHVIWQCSRFEVQRDILLRNGMTTFRTLPWPVHSLLATKDLKSYTLLGQFINGINIFI
ncbi:PREDICTED: uncharacterized protein LOC106750627 [Dinoponera quadriceps]|uniref:Uncharacterized protein LOC106750627 n=1 Tax=Dinoponera quadriceps TaxID=609295 RepID=A0A6P3Y9B7_DINQU|nr:PREDICTED: uncharacterized protein LOC106750627 [Dinoponera quadriceps]